MPLGRSVLYGLEVKEPVQDLALDVKRNAVVNQPCSPQVAKLVKLLNDVLAGTDAHTWWPPTRHGSCDPTDQQMESVLLVRLLPEVNPRIKVEECLPKGFREFSVSAR